MPRPPETTVGGRIRVLDLDEVAGLFRPFALPEHLEEFNRGDMHFNHSFPRSARFKVSAH